MRPNSVTNPDTSPNTFINKKQIEPEIILQMAKRWRKR